jgi:catechol 2,3-dioxygenase-like lactoylglutathione lyase family enzyme
MKTTFQHLHLFCRHLEPMISFWVEAVNAQLVERRKMGVADGAELLLADGLRLFIRGAAPADTEAVDASKDTSIRFSSYDHVAYTVDNIQDVLAFLAKRKDVTVTRSPFQSGANCCAFIRGPEGINVELVQLGTACS